MARFTTLLFIAIISILIIAPQSAVFAQTTGKITAQYDTGWPQVFQSGGNAVTIYQPQFDSWRDSILKARAAVSVSIKASALPEYGVVHFAARTKVDKSSGIVTLEQLSIYRINFPKAGRDTAEYQMIIKNSLPDWPTTIALERLQADLAIAHAERRTQEEITVKNEPPRIFFSTKPAVLVLIDGTPVPRTIEGTSLMRIINTRALVVLDKNNGNYYLYLAGHWEEAAHIEGTWVPSQNPPASLASVLEDARRSKAVDLLENARNESGELAVFVSTVPAELIIARGAPNLQPIKGTQLLFCSNSDNDIFFDLNDQHYYILISGRWYRGTALERGPWTFVPGRSLPADFAKIPENHPKGSVLASIPGTAQAKEAVISNSIPQTAAVERGEAHADVTYDGDPQFVPIAGTPLRYAINSPVPVIEVDHSSFFCVINGVWFSATSPEGPWVVADWVPAIIYTIPPSCPIHYVVYVKVYGSTPDVVYVGYTPGYLGAIIGVDGTVVYGTGFFYYPWIGTVWYGCPITWGYGFQFGWYSWGWGWSCGYFYGWRPLFLPWWGPMWAWGPIWWYHQGWPHGLSFHVNAYSRWGSGVAVHVPFHMHGAIMHGAIHGVPHTNWIAHMGRMPHGLGIEHHWNHIYSGPHFSRPHFGRPHFGSHFRAPHFGRPHFGSHFRAPHFGGMHLGGFGRHR